MGSGKHLIAGLVGSAALFGSLATVPWSDAAVAQTRQTPHWPHRESDQTPVDSLTIVRLEGHSEGATGSRLRPSA
jgi:hypothetical protein